MTSRTRCIALLVLILLAPGLAVADGEWQKLTHPSGGITMGFPPTWLLDQQDQSLLAWSPDDAVRMLFRVIADDRLAVAVAAMNRELAEQIDDARMTRPTETEFNGMDAVAANGTGAIDGRSVDIGVVLVRTGDDQVLLIMGFSVVGKADTHVGDVQRILASIGPTGGS